MALLTRILRTLLVFASFSVSLLVVAISGIWIRALSFGSYSAGLLALFPWFFGICGVAGLFRSRSDRATRSAWELRTDVVLLLLGVIGALIFAVLYMDRFGASSGVVPLAVLAIFPLLPVGVAAAEIHRSDGRDYWWSFRERKFVWYRPGMWFRVPPTACQGPVHSHLRGGIF